MMQQYAQAMESGELGVWDLRFDLESVHHSPSWKQRLGFPDPQHADSTHFWRCRVHPQDLELMLGAMREHVRGVQPHYEARFRLRSNGSGYRLMHSRGRVIERTPEGRALRMVGTMVDLTERLPSPQGGLPLGPRGSMKGAALKRPFHELLAPGADAGEDTSFHHERARVIGLVEDLLDASLAQLASRGATAV